MQIPDSRTKFSSESVKSLEKNNQYPGFINYSVPPSLPTIEPHESPIDLFIKIIKFLINFKI